MFAAAAAFLIRMVAVTSSSGAWSAADGKILGRPLGLNAVVGLGRNLVLAERIAFAALHRSPSTSVYSLSLPVILAGCFQLSSTACSS